MPPGRRALGGIFGEMLDPLLRVVKKSEPPKPLTNREKAYRAASVAKRTNNPMDRVPAGAERKPMKGSENIARGVQFTWEDALGKHGLRVHDRDAAAPKGTNAARGPIYRVEHWRLYEDAEGNLYDPRRQIDPETGEYDEAFANKTHIPWPDDIPLPYPDEGRIL